MKKKSSCRDNTTVFGSNQAPPNIDTRKRWGGEGDEDCRATVYWGIIVDSTLKSRWQRGNEKEKEEEKEKRMYFIS